MNGNAKEKLKRLPFGFWLTALALWLYGGGPKPVAVTVAWDEFFRSGAASVDTNDLRNIGFTWLPVADWLPATAQARLSAVLRPGGALFFVTNAPMSALALTARMPSAATNYLYWMECDWVPEPSVVTNGVYHIRAAGTATNAVPVGARVINLMEENP